MGTEANADLKGLLTAELAGPNRGGMSSLVQRVGGLVKGSTVTCRPLTSAADAARLMARHGATSVVVVDDEGAPVGIVTHQDFGAKVVAANLSSATPVSEIMSAPLVSIEASRAAFDGLLEMTRRSIHHLGVVDGGRLLGVVSSHDLVLLQGAHPVALAREIEAQPSVDGLAIVAPRVPDVIRSLVSGGAGPFDIGRVVAELNDRLVRRTVALVEAALEAEGYGRAPVAYSWLVAGSQGRREQTLTTDQDNALVYQDPPDDLRATASAYFGRLAAAVGEVLVRLGQPSCAGGFMASNSKWCQSESVWRRYFESWMETPHPDWVLSASIYFDFRPAASDVSDAGPGRAICEWVCERAPSKTLFLRYMARAAFDKKPGLGLFGGFAVERAGAQKGRLDLKFRGVFPVTQAMRVHALSLGIRETNTVDRLREVGARGAFTPAEAREIREAFEVICRVRIVHQIACLDAGRPPDNFIDPHALGKSDRLLLKEALKTLRWLQRGLEDRFLTATLG